MEGVRRIALDRPVGDSWESTANQDLRLAIAPRMQPDSGECGLTARCGNPIAGAKGFEGAFQLEQVLEPHELKVLFNELSVISRPRIFSGSTLSEARAS